MTEFSKIVQPRLSENVKFIKTGDLNLSVLEFIFIMLDADPEADAGSAPPPLK